MKDILNAININSILKEIIGVILSFIAGYSLHVMQSKFDKKDIKKSTSQIVLKDIKKSIELSNEYLVSEVECVVNYKFSNLADWKNDFQILVSSLNNVQRQQFIEFYDTVSEIEDIQNRYSILIDEFFTSRGMNKYCGPIGINIPGKSSLERYFVKLIEKLQSTDVKDLLCALEKI